MTFIFFLAHDRQCGCYERLTNERDFTVDTSGNDGANETAIFGAFANVIYLSSQAD